MWRPPPREGHSLVGPGAFANRGGPSWCVVGDVGLAEPDYSSAGADPHLDQRSERRREDPGCPQPAPRTARKLHQRPRASRLRDAPDAPEARRAPRYSGSTTRSPRTTISALACSCSSCQALTPRRSASRWRSHFRGAETENLSRVVSGGREKAFSAVSQACRPEGSHALSGLPLSADARTHGGPPLTGEALRLSLIRRCRPGCRRVRRLVGPPRSRQGRSSAPSCGQVSSGAGIRQPHADGVSVARGGQVELSGFVIMPGAA